jgi:phosphoribosylformylglycinamidine synthase PurS subunit
MFWRNILRSRKGLTRHPGIEQCAPRAKPKLKAKVFVTLKASVLDPQGKAIKHSVELLGFNGISDIRQGKYFEIVIDGALSEPEARAEAMRMARDVLSNPIIEDFRVEIES